MPDTHPLGAAIQRPKTAFLRVLRALRGYRTKVSRLIASAMQSMPSSEARNRSPAHIGKNQRPVYVTEQNRENSRGNVHAGLQHFITTPVVIFREVQ